jgi:hypothetical protein
LFFWSAAWVIFPAIRRTAASIVVCAAKGIRLPAQFGTGSIRELWRRL